MNKLSFLKCLITTCSQVIRFSEPSTLLWKFRQQFTDSWLPDILTLEEVAHYLRVEPEILLKEVIEGHLPGGKLAGQWHFYKEALIHQFSVYHGSAPDDLTDYYEGFYLESENKVCELKTVQELIEAYARGERNFSGSDLRGALLSNVSLPEIDLVESFLMNIDLSNSNLRKAELQQARLQGANLSSADLSYANLEGANLSNADLSRTIFIGANLRQATLTGVNFSAAQLQNTSF